MIKNFVFSFLVLLAFQSFSQVNIQFDATTGPTGGRVFDIESNSSLELFAISDDKLYKSIDNAITWFEITPDNGNSGLIDVFVDNSEKIYLLDKTRVWTSVDNGMTWSFVTATGAYNPKGKLLKNPISGTLFCMDYNNFGLMRSSNDGASWTQVYDGSSAELRDYTIGNTGLIFLGANGGGNLLKSTNNGISFDAPITSPVGGTVTDVEVNKSNGRIYILYSNSTEGIYVTDNPANDGDSWARVTTLANGLTFPSGANNFHALIPSSARIFVRDGQDLYYSDNATSATATWTQLANYDAGNNEVFVGRALSSANILMGLGEDGIYGSTTSGASWTFRDQGIFNNSTRSFIRTNNGNLLAVNGGSAIAISTNDGDTWTKETLCSSCNFSSLIKKPNGDILAIGSETYGSTAANGGNVGTWTDLGGPPAMVLVERASSSDGSLIWGHAQETSLHRSTDGGVTFTAPALTGLPMPLRVFDLTVDGGNNLFFWTDTDEIYKIPSGSSVATKVTNSGLTNFRGLDSYNGIVFLFGYDPATDSEAYAKSSDGGSNWTRQNVESSNAIAVVTEEIMFSLQAAGGDQASITWTNDAGENWYEAFNGTYYDSQIAGAAIDNIGRGYIVISGAELRRSQSTIVKPAKPTNLKVIGVADKVVFLEWDYSSVGGAILDYYEIHRKPTSGGTFEKVGEADGDVLYFADRTTSKNTAYDYQLVAGNDAGETTSDPISISTKDDCPATIPDNRSWDGLVGAVPTASPVLIRKLSSDYYSISEFTAGTLNGVARIGGGTYSTTTVSTIFNDACGTPFIEEKNDVFPNGNGTWNGSNSLTLKFQINKGEYTDTEKMITLTLRATDPAPVVPSNLSAYAINDTQVQLQWTAGDYQQKYIIERSLTSTTGFSQIGTVNYPNLTFADSGPLTAGTTYFYRIKAENINMVASAYSAEKSIVFSKPIFVLSNTTVSNTNASAPTMAWADLDNDGFEDLIMAKLSFGSQIPTEPLLFKNNAGADFQSVTGQLPIAANMIAPTVADYNNDGNLDIFIAGIGIEGLGVNTLKNLLIKNDGNFTFTNVTGSVVNDVEVGQSSFGGSWVDVNSNGFIDLFIPFEDAAGQKLYAGAPNGAFTENTAAGALVSDSFSKGPTFWSDYDNDGDMDAFVLASSSLDPNRLYNNNGGVFTRVTGSAFEGVFGSFFSASWGDYNNDQFMDLFIADQDGANILFKNNGNGTFSKQTEVADSPTENLSIASFGSAWGDVDNDGDLDLFVPSAAAPNLFYLNQGNGTFTKVKNEEIAGFNINFNLGAAFADYNNDGHLDVVLGPLNFPIDGENGIVGDNPRIKLFKNNLTTGNWIKVKLNGAAGPQAAISNRAAIGARIKVVAGGKTQIREISSSTGTGAQSSLIAHFGLGAEATITTLEVKFPSGGVKTLSNVAANQLLVIDEDAEGPQVSTFVPKNRDKGFSSEEISLTATDAVSVTNLNIVFRPIGGKDFVTGSMGKVAGTNEWRIPIQEAWYDDMGLEFYFEASDPFGNTTRDPEPPGQNYNSYFNYKDANAPKFPTTSLVFGGTDKTWNIVSIPFDLGSSATVTSVLDELGAFDDTQWRLLTYLDQTSWSEFPGNFSSFNRGQGYFLNIKTPPSAGITIASEILAPQNNQSNLFSMNLKQGWNQIGNPYLVNVNWTDVKVFNGGVSGVGDLKVYSSNGRSYGDGTVLGVYGGGFVFANEAVTTYIISFPGQTSGGRKGNAGRIASTELDADDWRTKFTLKQSDVTFTLGGIGMNPGAKLSYDDFDDVTLPRLTDFLEMNFHHPEHFAKRFSRDIVPTQEEYNWEFTVDSNLEGIATFNWDNESFGSNDKELYLMDVNRQKLIDMRMANSYSFDSETSNQFKVYYGTNLKSRIQPDKILLGQAYPNPASSVTTIPFTLPQANGLYQVRLDVYDMMGRKVSVIHDGLLPSGFYESQWDPSAAQLGSGMYTYRLAVNGGGKSSVLSNKIILKK